MSHDRGCFNCGDDLPPRTEGCGRRDCPYGPHYMDYLRDVREAEKQKKMGRFDNKGNFAGFPPGQPIKIEEKVKMDREAQQAKEAERVDKLMVDSGDAFLDMLQGIANEDARGLTKAQKSYGNSWKSRGGVGAFMMLARKWDRLENRVQRTPANGAAPYDIFAHVASDQRAEGVIDDIRDLRRYLLLVEAELRARGFDATHRDNRKDA